MLNSFKQMTPLLKNIHNGYKLFIMNIVINLHNKKIMKTKVSKMKKIVFSKLWKHDTFYKIKNVRL
jgi:hypothetical protein